MKKILNFLPSQYKKTNSLRINHNYLKKQFYDYDDILNKIKTVVIDGDFTLGNQVEILENNFAKLCNSKYAIGVGSGTDALFLSLKAYGIKDGDEVITTPFTFYATIGAIVTAGAKPVYVDIKDDMNIDVDLIESRITKKTKAIMPVHWSGNPCEMDKLNKISKKFKIPIIADSCHAIRAKYKGNDVGCLSDVSCYSFHPLKNLNIWGDGGIIVTNNLKINNKLRLLRNHGLVGRDSCEIYGYNSRLDTVQAVVATHMMRKIDKITNARISNSEYLDKGLSCISEIQIPHRNKNVKQVFHLYQIYAKKRNSLQKYLITNGIDAKVHYSKPMHLQKAAMIYGYKKGDFKVAEKIASSVISFPVHEFIKKKELDFIIKKIKLFYKK